MKRPKWLKRKPTSSERIQALRRIVDGRKGESIDGHFVDVYTAQTVLTVYGSLKQENHRKQIESGNIRKAIYTCWEVVAAAEVAAGKGTLK